MYRRILYATALSIYSHEIGHRAKALADEYGATLHLAHVIENAPTYGMVGVVDEEWSYVDEVREELAELGEEFGVALEHQYIQHGAIKLEIVELAKKIGADLIVVGSHTQEGLSLLIGSAANAILHAADCDVLLVRIPDHTDDDE